MAFHRATLPEFICLIIFCLACLTPPAVSAEFLCLKVTGKLSRSKDRFRVKHSVGGSCPAGYEAVVDLEEFRGPAGEQGLTGAQGATGSAGAVGPVGPTGSQGVAGADGSIRIYGDGSAGDLVVSSNLLLTSANVQFNSITIEPGNTFTVESGTILRVAGNFENDGNIIVNTFAFGGKTASGNGFASPYREPQAGIGRSAALGGNLGNSAVILDGGLGGNGLTLQQAMQLLQPGQKAGGGGAGGFSDGGPGGGSLTVIAAGTITNSGNIMADGLPGGSDGGGGGGGGVIILASASGVTNTGSISADGGNGGAHSADSGPGGGGGGIIHFIAPSIVSTGPISIIGGTGSSGGAGVINNPRAAGGGGGASGGSGGQGGDVFTNNSAAAAVDGSAGHFIQTISDPTSLF